MQKAGKEAAHLRTHARYKGKRATGVGMITVVMILFVDVVCSAPIDSVKCTATCQKKCNGGTHSCTRTCHHASACPPCSAQKIYPASTHNLNSYFI